MFSFIFGIEGTFVPRPEIEAHKKQLLEIFEQSQGGTYLTTIWNNAFVVKDGAGTAHHYGSRALNLKLEPVRHNRNKEVVQF